MKKLMVLCLVMLMVLAGCANVANESSWSENDFSFYDNEGKEVLFPTADDYWIFLENFSGAKTFKDVLIGDKAETAMQKYDLTDFQWSICDFSSISPSTEKSEKTEDIFKEKNKTVDDIVASLPEIAALGLDVYLYCDIYKLDDKLVTSSQLPIKTIKQEDLNQFSKGEIVSKYRYDDMFTINGEIKTLQQWCQSYEIAMENMPQVLYEVGVLDRDIALAIEKPLQTDAKLKKYTISFNIDGEVIADVSIESHYHNYLNVAIDGAGNIKKGYEWVEKLK